MIALNIYVLVQSRSGNVTQRIGPLDLLSCTVQGNCDIPACQVGNATSSFWHIWHCSCLPSATVLFRVDGRETTILDASLVDLIESNSAANLGQTLIRLARLAETIHYFEHAESFHHSEVETFDRIVSFNPKQVESESRTQDKLGTGLIEIYKGEGK